jgi:hypothetical protein
MPSTRGESRNERNVIATRSAALAVHATRADGALGCPAASEVVLTGASCEWPGMCTVLVDICNDGQASPIPCVCTGGRVAFPPGTGISCVVEVDATAPPPEDATSPFVCPLPDEVGSGDFCNTTAQCPGTVDAPCQALETCQCVSGAWSCDGVSCGTGPGSGPGSGVDSGTRHKPPPPLHPEMMAGVYCPFSGADGGKDVTRAATEHCCEPIIDEPQVELIPRKGWPARSWSKPEALHDPHGMFCP